MAKFQEKKKKQSWLFSKISIVFLFVFLVVVAKATWDMKIKDNLAKNNLAIARQKMVDLEKREKELQGKIDQLQTVRGLESEIRQNFPVVKTGERVINIIDERGTGTGTSSTSTKPWWKIL